MWCGVVLSVGRLVGVVWFEFGFDFGWLWCGVVLSGPVGLVWFGFWVWVLVRCWVYAVVWSGLVAGRSVGRLVGWLVGWLIGWLVGWLLACLLACLSWVGLGWVGGLGLDLDLGLGLVWFGLVWFGFGFGCVVCGLVWSAGRSVGRSVG